MSRIAVSLVGGCLVLRRLAAVHRSQHLQQGVFGLALADLEPAYPRPYLPVRVPRRYPVGIVDLLSYSPLYEFIGVRYPEFEEPSGWNYADQGPGRGGGLFPDVLNGQPVYCPFDFAGVSRATSQPLSPIVTWARLFFSIFRNSATFLTALGCI